jgi:hypothetical protein
MPQVLHMCNFFQAVKVTHPYSSSMHLWNHIAGYNNWPGYIELNWDSYYSEPAFVSAIVCTMPEPESMSECNISVTTNTARIVRLC